MRHRRCLRDKFPSSYYYVIERERKKEKSFRPIYSPNEFFGYIRLGNNPVKLPNVLPASSSIFTFRLTVWCIEQLDYVTFESFCSSTQSALAMQLGNFLLFKVIFKLFILRPASLFLIDGDKRDL